MVFVDAGALVKRYVRERHSAHVRNVVTAGPVAISRLSEVEVPPALTRLARERRLSPRTSDRAIAAFITDVPAWHIVEITPDVTALARRLLARHDLRAGDAIQLASAVWLRPTVPLSGVLAFDARVVNAAQAEQFSMPVTQDPPRALARGRRR